MGKFLLRLFIVLLIFIFSFTIYLSYFGVETNKFDALIKNKVNEVNQNVKLEFNKTKIYLNPIDFILVVKLKNPKILVRNNEIDLSKLNLSLSVRSFFSSDFLLKRAEVSFFKNDIKDLTKITSIFVPKFINKRIDKIFANGEIEGQFIIPFDRDGNIGNDYKFSGKVLNASINLTKEFNIKNLTTEISHTKEGKNISLFNFIIKNGSVLDFELKDSTFTFKRENNQTDIASLIRTNGKFDLFQVKSISSLLNLNLDNLKDIKGKGDFTTDINFKLDKKYRIKNLKYSMQGIIPLAAIHLKKQETIKKYLPDYDDKVILKDSKITLIKEKNNNIIELNGYMKTNNEFDNFNLKQIYDLNKKSFNITGNADLTNYKVNISKLNYIKEKGKKSEINFDFNFVINSYYNITKLLFLSDKSKIYISGLKLNKNFEINNFKKLEVKTYKNEDKNNDFLVKKTNEIIISGEIFDAQSLLKSLVKKEDRKTFSKKFSSKIKINFDKVITGTNDDVSNFGMIAKINMGSYDKLSLKGNFSENEIIEMSIYQIDNNKRTLQVISDRARPFMKNFEFIKGFEGGKLEYESIISKEGSNSNLLLTNFKVSKVPALAKLLTLASLQGIADTLSGEGVRFEFFEMKSNSKGNVMNIEDALAIGPAVSILLEGYVDKGKIVSLRGTLVPATKLNSIIASIPVVGDILVGKKSGEGVVGVSFKMKGPPKDMKTTVNPIKTLTPRFIVRAIEKMKKKKKEETK